MRNKKHCPICRGDKLTKLDFKRGLLFKKYKLLCDTCGYVFYKRVIERQGR
jgi:hypothetical protein